MKIEYFEITLPYQPPQTVAVRTWGNGVSRCAIQDQFQRLFWLNGEKVGFDVTVYRATTQPPRMRLVILGNYEDALFTSWDGITTNVSIKALK